MEPCGKPVFTENDWGRTPSTRACEGLRAYIFKTLGGITSGPGEFEIYILETTWRIFLAVIAGRKEWEGGEIEPTEKVKIGANQEETVRFCQADQTRKPENHEWEKNWKGPNWPATSDGWGKSFSFVTYEAIFGLLYGERACTKRFQDRWLGERYHERILSVSNERQGCKPN